MPCHGSSSSCFMPSEMRWVSWLILMILHLHRLADVEHLGRVVDAPPRDVGDVQQAVDAAEVDERAVVGDVLDHAVDDLALFEVLHQLLALLGAASPPARCGATPRCCRGGDPSSGSGTAAASFISGVTSRIGRMSTWLRGRNATAPSRSTVKPPLTWLKMTPSTFSFAVERLLELAPALLAARLVARQHRLAERVLDALEIDLDGVADLELGRPARAGEFASAATRPSVFRPTSMTAMSFSMPTTVPLTTEPSCRLPWSKDSSSIVAKSSREGAWRRR